VAVGTAPPNVVSSSSVLPVPSCGEYSQATARQPAVPSAARRSVPRSGTLRTCVTGAGREALETPVRRSWAPA
jgi:hypothetical protein